MEIHAKSEELLIIHAANSSTYLASPSTPSSGTWAVHAIFQNETLGLPQLTLLASKS